MSWNKHPTTPTKQKVDERWMHLKLRQNVQEGEETKKGLIATVNCQEKFG